MMRYPRCHECEKTRGRAGEGIFGGVRTQIMGERGCGCYLRLTTVLIHV